jgi:Fe-S-cluster containining protein
MHLFKEEAEGRMAVSTLLPGHTLPACAGPAAVFHAAMPDVLPPGIPESLRSALTAVYDRTHERQALNTVAVMAAGLTGAPPRMAEHVVADAFRLMGELVAASPARAGYQCGQGCAWCCHQPIRVTAPEAIAIADALREAYPGDWLVTLKRMLADRVRRIAALGGDADYLAARLPCAFLAPDNSCSIYAWRPVVCRGYHSLSKAACQEKYVDLAAPAPPIDAYAHTAANAVHHGMAAAVAAAGRDGGTYELHAAVLTALDIADAAAAWWRGAPLTAPP